MLGSSNRDSVRNTLLVLAAKGRIEKRGAGQYQARTLSTDLPPGAPDKSASTKSAPE